MITRWRLSATGVVGLAMVGTVIVVAVFAPWLMVYDPTQVNPINAMQPPIPFDGSGWDHALGTDNLGRDMLSRLIQGSRISLLVGVCAVVFAGLIGLTIGVVSGYFGKWVDATTMRVVDAFLAIPSILMILVVLGVLEPSIPTLIVVLGLTNWVMYARQIRSEVLEIRQRQFVKASRTFGTSDTKIMLRHVVPNVMPTFIVLSTLSVASIIVLESSLSFLGLGIQPPTVSWGIMLTSGRDYVSSAWWLSTFPGVAITLTVLGILFLGDWIRDVLDPKLRD